MTQVRTIRCTHVLAQISLGFYDEEGNLVSEETFPQVNGSIAAARLFYPHSEQLANLIEICVRQAWEKLGSGGHVNPAIPGTNGFGDDRGQEPAGARLNDGSSQSR